MKLGMLLQISAFILAFVHPEAAQVAATAVLLLIVIQIDRKRKASRSPRPSD